MKEQKGFLQLRHEVERKCYNQQSPLPAYVKIFLYIRHAVIRDRKIRKRITKDSIQINTGISVRTIQREIKKLEQMMLISIHSSKVGKKNLPNEYSLNEKYFGTLILHDQKNTEIVGEERVNDEESYPHENESYPHTSKSVTTPPGKPDSTPTDRSGPCGSNAPSTHERMRPVPIGVNYLESLDNSLPKNPLKNPLKNPNIKEPLMKNDEFENEIKRKEEIIGDNFTNVKCLERDREPTDAEIEKRKNHLRLQKAWIQETGRIGTREEFEEWVSRKTKELSKIV